MCELALNASFPNIKKRAFFAMLPVRDSFIGVMLVTEKLLLKEHKTDLGCLCEQHAQ